MATLLADNFGTHAPGPPVAAETGQAWVPTGDPALGVLEIRENTLSLNDAGVNGYVQAVTAGVPTAIQGSYRFTAPGGEVCVISHREANFVGLNMGLHLVINDRELDLQLRKSASADAPGPFESLWLHKFSQGPFQSDLPPGLDLGVVVAIDGDSITVQAPDGVSQTVTDSRVSELIGHKLVLQSKRASTAVGRGAWNSISVSGTLGVPEVEPEPAPTSALVCAAWATTADLPTERPTLDRATWEHLLLIATETLWALSGRQWSGQGDCTATALWSQWPGGCAPMMGRRGHFDPNAGHRRIQLPHDEVREVLSVTVNGRPFAGYRLRGQWLEREDGWPWDASGAARVQVVYRWGKPPPAGGVEAAVQLAVELAKSSTGDKGCRLPKATTTVSRQGVSITMADPMAFLSERRTGLPEVDRWLMTANPGRVSERASLWSPDVARARLV